MTDLEPRDKQAIIDPRTGVMFPIEEVKDDLLVEIFTALEQREKQFQEWRRAAEDELVRRHDDLRHGDDWVVAGKQLSVDRGWSRTWDPTELGNVVEDLVERGALTVQDVAGLLTPQDPKVDGRRAAELLDRGREDIAVELRRCFSWKKGRARVKVTPTAQLES